MAKVEKILRYRLEREFNKLFIERRPMPILYLIGYFTAICDIAFESFGSNKRKFLEFMKWARELELKLFRGG